MRLPSISFLLSFSFLAQTHGQDQTYTQAYIDLMSSDLLINADIWDSEPKIMSANWAYSDIMGVEDQTQAGVEAAGGSWLTGKSVNKCKKKGFPFMNSAPRPSDMAIAFGVPTFFMDAMPVVFSWPVKVTTVQTSDFRLHLNTGEVVTPAAVSIRPNQEPNERSCVILVGEFGNRIPPDEEGAIYVETVEIVEDESPLMLVGPKGVTASAVNMTYDASCCIPYANNAVGPTLAAAKLSRFSAAGELPGRNRGQGGNSCLDLYGSRAQYRLRMYTTGGFTPNGVSALKPTDYAKHFRLYADPGNGGHPFPLTGTELEYRIGAFGKVELLGMADLGIWRPWYDDCYQEDKDNYIDICIDGDEAAVRQIKWLEMPAGNATADPTNQYGPLYNPGGPGNNPAPGVKYTAPSPYLMLDVIMALDNPMTVTVNAFGL